jgi:hypothetical protein
MSTAKTVAVVQVVVVVVMESEVLSAVVVMSTGVVSVVSVTSVEVVVGSFTCGNQHNNHCRW